MKVPYTDEDVRSLLHDVLVKVVVLQSPSEQPMWVGFQSLSHRVMEANCRVTPDTYLMSTGGCG